MAILPKGLRVHSISAPQYEQNIMLPAPGPYTTLPVLYGSIPARGVADSKDFLSSPHEELKIKININITRNRGLKRIQSRNLTNTCIRYS